MHVLVMASQKGGSGKTTLSGHLAVEAEQAGLGPVSLIDTDPQGSLAQWWNARDAVTPHFANVQLAELGDALDHMRQAGIKLAVIDTPPAVTESISRVVAHADLVVVPTRPSPHDLRAVGATVDIAEQHHKPVVFVLNAATARARITGEAAIALSQHGTVAPVTLHHRVDYAASMVDGRTAGEVVPKSPSAREMHDLWLYIQNRLSRLKHDPQIASAETNRFALASLSPLDAAAGQDEPETETESETETTPAPAPVPAYSGPERRSGTDRRVVAANFSGPERRTGTFGRRATDRVIPFGKSGT